MCVLIEKLSCEIDSMSKITFVEPVREIYFSSSYR